MGGTVFVEVCIEYARALTFTTQVQLCLFSAKQCSEEKLRESYTSISSVIRNGPKTRGNGTLIIGCVIRIRTLGPERQVLLYLDM